MYNGALELPMAAEQRRKYYKKGKDETSGDDAKISGGLICDFSGSPGQSNKQRTADQGNGRK